MFLRFFTFGDKSDVLRVKEKLCSLLTKYISVDQRDSTNDTGGPEVHLPPWVNLRCCQERDREREKETLGNADEQAGVLLDGRQAGSCHGLPRNNTVTSRLRSVETIVRIFITLRETKLRCPHAISHAFLFYILLKDIVLHVFKAPHINCSAI